MKRWMFATIVSTTSLFGSFTDDFARFLHEETENWIFSPLSLQTCLGMAGVGADGETAECLTDLPLGTPHIKGAKMSNGCWVRSGFPLEESYPIALENLFHAQTQSAPFTEETVFHINQWVEGQTEGRIANLLPPGSLSGESSLCLVSALYTQGTWLRPFPENSTHKELFYSHFHGTQETWMMEQTGQLPYFENGDFQAVNLSLKTEDGPLSFLLVLPKIGKTLSHFSPPPLSSFELRNVRLVVPKFRAEKHFEASKILREIGFAPLFSRSANFSKICLTQPLHIGQVFHKVYLDFQEKGLEAAAATATSFCTIVSLPAEKKMPVFFNANRPFAYFLIDPQCDIPLFAGWVELPHIR